MKTFFKSATSILLILVLFHSCQKKFLCPDCENKPPVAKAGIDQKITLPKDSITLDGSASTDPDGKIVSYKWIKISGPTSSNIIKATSPVTVVKALVMGVYKFELTVTDDESFSAKDTIQVIVDDPKVNQPPVANAGADQTIIFPADSVRLDGRASFDPDGMIVSYKWIKISGPSAAINKPDSSSTIVKGLIAGLYQFELMVKDNGSLISKDTVKVLVDIPGNHPPVACAGADQIIIVPANMVTLDGSCSTDPENNITSYSWIKISGPSSFAIANANTVQTQLSSLVEGVYQFELKVIDAGGLFSKDTIQVTVKPAGAYTTCTDTVRPYINAQLIPVGTLSQPRSGIAVASAGTKVLFAGPGSTVDIFDFATNTWSIAQISLGPTPGRGFIAAVAAGNKVFFAGGLNDNGDPLQAVDIYDVSTNTWSVSQLSRAANGLAGAAAGNKVFFAGGNSGIYPVNTVDIYDLITNTWSTESLSVGRNFITAVSANNKVYFTGGDPWTGQTSKVIDIYDNNTATWSTSTLQISRGYHAAIEFNGVLYFAGGKLSTTSPSLCSVETLNINTGARSLMNLFSPASWYFVDGQNAVVKNNKIIFLRHEDTAGTNKFDIYDLQTKTWSIGVLPVNVTGASIISVNNTIYVAGVYVNNVLSDKVYELDF